MRLKIAIVVVFAVMAGMGFVSVSRRGSDPGAFSKDFRTAVSMQTERTEALQAQARRALGGDTATLIPVFESMHEAAQRSVAELERLRAPGAHARALHRVVDVAQEEVDALERVIASASAGVTEDLATQLSDLAEALRDREMATRTVLEALEDER